MSLQLRVRPLEFGDGNFEEVRMTLNASRNGLYFFTKLDRYYKGMRLRVMCPYDPSGAGNWEETGEVVRVDRKPEGFGVAVGLSCSGYPIVPDVRVPAMRREDVRAAERRCDLRSPFIALAEVLDIRSGIRMQARTSDLSFKGCYVDTLNPFPVGTTIQLRIEKRAQVFDVSANVSSQHPGCGMGVVFRELTAAERATLECWLCDSLVASETPPPAAVHAPTSAPPSAAGDSPALRLIHTLVRKGVLTKSEAMELLSDSHS